MRTVQSEIRITAPPGQVWDALTDFAAYGEWSSFIAGISGSLEVGSKLTVQLQPPGGRKLTFKPTLTHAAPARHLGWLGRLPLPGLFDGAHDFILSPVDSVDGVEGTHLLQRETFTGVLVPLFGRVLDRTTIGFEAFNQALKTRAETPATHA